MDIDGIKVTVKGDPYPGEIEGYVRRGLREHGKRLTAIEITLDGADCDIYYILKRPFERIRRITGYQQKTGQWNNAKRAEEHDRVKHGPANQCVTCGAEMPEGDHVCKQCRDSSSAIYPHGLNVRVTDAQMDAIERARIQNETELLEEIKDGQKRSISILTGDIKTAREYVASFLEGMNKELKIMIDAGLGGVPAEMSIMRNNICIDALLQPQLDENGLVPCGCGGKAVDNEGIDYGYGYKCQKCGIATMAGANRDCAKEEWNTAMGWKGGAE